MQRRVFCGWLLWGRLGGAGARAEDTVSFVADPLALRLPASVKVRYAEGASYKQYSFTEGKEWLLEITLVRGTEKERHAMLFSGGEPKKPTEVINGLGAISYHGVNKYGSQRTTFLMTGLPEEKEYIEFHYTGLTPDRAEIADGIIASARLYTPTPEQKAQRRATQRREAIATLKAVPDFAMTGVGIIGRTSEGELALRLLVEDRATDTLVYLLQTATLPGKMYALLGLKQLAPGRFARAVELFLHNHKTISVWSGCSSGGEFVYELARSIQAGLYDPRFSPQPDAGKVNAG